jgi:hypothetical protein
VVSQGRYSPDLMTAAFRCSAPNMLIICLFWIARLNTSMRGASDREGTHIERSLLALRLRVSDLLCISDLVHAS